MHWYIYKAWSMDLCMYVYLYAVKYTCATEKYCALKFLL